MLETLRNLLIVFILITVALVAVKVVDIFTAVFENHVEPLVYQAGSSMAKEISNTTGVHPANVSDYNIYEQSRSPLSILDAAVAIAVLAMIAGVFIYNRTRT